MSDLIDRQKAIDAILHITNCKSVRELFEYNQEHHLTEMWSGGVNDAIDAVVGVESATDNNVGTELGTNLASLGTDCISRRSAIEAICNACGKIDCDKMDKCEKLQLPHASCSEFPNNSDTISRQAAIDALRKMQTYKMFSGDDMLLIDQAGAQTELMLLPPAEPKRGRWIGKYPITSVCSECGFLIHDSKVKAFAYCPNCGADMRGEQDG